MHFIWSNEQAVPLPPGIGAVFEDVFAAAQQHTLRKQAGVVCMTLIDDRTMRHLNATYRHIDRTTDVLSFGGHTQCVMEPFCEARDEGIQEEDGEIMICVSVAAEQAIEKNTSLQNELALLFAHGLLHLFGYDHADEATEREMFSRQAAILRAVGYDGD
jgi:probable rRNA maturation factor